MTDWSKMKKLHVVGAYLDERGHLHVNLNEVLQAHGLPDTPANRSKVVENLKRTMAEGQKRDGKPRPVVIEQFE